MIDYPLAQTFLINPDQVGPAEGAYLTSIDLYFSHKDPKLGVSIELRECIGANPGFTILPYGQVHLRSSEVNVSSTGATKTVINFESPVFVKQGMFYAIVIKPDGGSPEYKMITAVNGKKDLITTKTVQNDTPHNGSLWRASSDEEWSGAPDEDLKYTLYAASYDAADAKVEMVNDDYEFFTVDTVVGTFNAGEWVHQDPGSNTANASANITLSTANNIITAGANARWSSTFANGDYITLVSNSATKTEVVKITSVDSDTQITLQNNPNWSDNQARFRNARVGKVTEWDSGNNLLTIEQSTTVNSSVKFATNKTIRGAESNGTANVASIDNIEIAYVEPVMYRTTTGETDLGLEYKYSGMDANVGAIWGDRNYLPKQGYVKSKTNEVASHTGSTYSNTLKSLNTDIRFQTTTTYASPVLELQNSSLLSYRSYINDSSANEWKSGADAQGSADAKYISRIVELNSGLDAEDMKVFATVYQPSGTKIECYARILNESDETPFKERQWTELEQVTAANTYSSGEDRENFIELEWDMPTGHYANTTSANGAVGTTNQSSEITTSTDTSSDVSAGDLIYIDGGSKDSYQVSRVSAANSTVITINDTVGMANNDYPIRIVDATHKNQAFKDPQGSTAQMTSYFNTDGAKFETYKQFQLKFVLRADEAWKHPLIKDYRAIALSV